MQRLDLRTICHSARPIIGMVHLQALPGAPAYRDIRYVVHRALRDARALAEGGVHAIMIENFGDAPFLPEAVPPETIAAMARVVSRLRRATTVPLGVNVLRNDARAALAIAATCGADFIRVNVHTGAMLTDQGWINGRAHETLRLRASLGAQVAILADVLVKHAVPPPGLTVADAARDTWHRGLADALILSGPATGAPVDAARIHAVREVVPDATLLLGSGVDPDNAERLLPLVDGAIVGSAFQVDGRAGGNVDRQRVHRFMQVANSL